MRGLLLLTTILVTITLLPPPTVQTQQPEKDQFPKPHNPEKDKFPKPETYPPAGANCKNKWRLEPLLTMPEVRTGVPTNKSQCVLSVYNCKKKETDTYTSGERDSGTVDLDCSDYEKAKEALGRIEICCDEDFSACTKKERVWFRSSRKPVGNRGNLECRVDITICGKVTTEKTIVAYPLDVKSACDVFAGSVAAKYPSEVCCDCPNYERKRCQELRDAFYDFTDVLQRINRWPLSDDELKEVAALGPAITEPSDRPQCDHHHTDPAALDEIKQSLDTWIKNYTWDSRTKSFFDGRTLGDNLLGAAQKACENWGGLGGEPRKPPPFKRRRTPR